MRTHTGNLPVYRKYNHDRTNKRTVIRLVEGDIDKFTTELSKVVSNAEIHVKVGRVEVNGLHKESVDLWLRRLGFWKEAMREKYIQKKWKAIITVDWLCFFICEFKKNLKRNDIVNICLDEDMYFDILLGKWQRCLDILDSKKQNKQESIWERLGFICVILNLEIVMRMKNR